MFTIRSKEKKPYLIIMIVMLTALTSCSSGPRVYISNSQVSVEPLITKKLVGTAILSASRFHDQWTITKVRSGEMKGILSYSHHRATVSIPYDAKHFQIVYQSSNNFAYEADDQTIHPRYNSWVKKLEDRIHKEIRYHLQLLEEQE